MTSVSDGAHSCLGWIAEPLSAAGTSHLDTPDNAENSLQGRPPAISGIIETKIRPPQIRSHRLARSELGQELAKAAQETGLVSIVAPAGSGKSTVLLDLHKALEDAGYRCCWLSLEPADDSPSEFARYVTAAAYPLNDGAVEKGLAFLRSQATEHLGSYFDGLIRTIAAMKGRFALFVDDFQVLSHPDIIRFWNRLVTYAPEGMCTVLASRAPLPIDLGRRRIAGKLFELPTTALNLTPEQIRAYMKDLHAVDLPPETARSLHESTEGWMVGLQLAGMAISGSKGNPSDLLRGFSAKDRNLKEYLFETVYDLQDEQTKNFLLQTASLSKFSAALCDAVTGDRDGRVRIDQIEAANLFLIPLDREGNWYRYHHLFSDFLRHELDRCKKFDKAELCNRAADWCIAQGQLTDAIQYCLDGSNFEKATDLIAEHAPVIAIDQGDHAMIFDWMHRLPREYHHKRPEILLHHAWSRAFTRDNITTTISPVDELESLLKQTDEPNWNLSQKDRDFYIDMIEIVRLIAMSVAEQASFCIEACDRLLNDRPDGAPIVIASAYSIKAHAHFLLNDLAASARAATNTYTLGKQADSSYGLIWADTMSCLSSIELGHLSSAGETARRALQNAGPLTAENSQCPAIAAMIMAEVSLQRCEFESAQRHLTEGRVLASISNPPLFLQLALRIEARLLACTGSLDNARVALQQGQETALRTRQPRLYYTLVAEEVNLLLHGGDFFAARDTLHRTGIMSLENPMIDASNRDNITEMVRLTEARMLLAEGRSVEAMRQLSSVQKSAQQQNRVALLQHIGALKSVALWKSGKTADAVRELDKMLSIAAPENHAWPLFIAGSGLLPILEAIRDKRSTDMLDDAQKLKHDFEKLLMYRLSGESISSIDSSDNPNLKPLANPPDLAEPLTSRELTILRLIGAGLGNQQLADEMLITLSTAKWHVHNIFEKLGVRNRTAAAAYARKHNLI